ncbi:hypothetical protein F503_03499 [Ophiostoma piceae UAMH 11346]|uniref:Uncharacterized protein n=1 Tax=Ophiostoma piceae (strain UAMH 11346) TaxID=1262450 RepID=S3C2R9_OPHP1|nr:hypothetical protein F503_03499 [Ophiostoma piceae UAMH 11346]
MWDTRTSRETIGADVRGESTTGYRDNGDDRDDRDDTDEAEAQTVLRSKETIPVTLSRTAGGAQTLSIGSPFQICGRGGEGEEGEEEMEEKRQQQERHRVWQWCKMWSQQIIVAANSH